MTSLFEDDPGPELDYRLCSVPGSRLQFRGPMPGVGDPYLAVLGGSETFGKYVSDPYPSLLADWIGMPVANLGVAQAGLSLFSEEQVLIDLASEAEVVVLQVLGAQNMSNRLYSVHTRRNDRFLCASTALQENFPQVDFAEINFTGHLVNRLSEASASAFALLIEELKWAWLQRMRRLLSLIKSDVILLWVSDRNPRDTRDALDEEEPRFVDQSMIDALRGGVAGFVEVVLPKVPSIDGKLFAEHEAEAARLLPGPSEHRRIAEALGPEVSKVLNTPGRGNAARVKDQSFSISSGTAVKRSATRP